jgi:hypothetical protein
MEVAAQATSSSGKRAATHGHASPAGPWLTTVCSGPGRGELLIFRAQRRQWALSAAAGPRVPAEWLQEARALQSLEVAPHMCEAATRAIQRH